MDIGTPEPLGAHVRDGGTNFAVWAPDADRIELCLFDDEGHQWSQDLTGFTKGVHHGFVPEVGAGQRYGFRAHGQWLPEKGLRFNPAKLLIDPYTRAVDGALTLNEAIFGHVGNDDTVFNALDSAAFVPRSVVVDSHFDWEDDKAPNVPWKHTIIYEAHVVGLTQLHPEVPEVQRGTFAGMCHPAIIAHLKSMGVTTIELLPTQQFVSETHLLARGAENYWGYNTLAFFAPHNAYSSNGTRGEQVNEFREMVKTYHRAGLEVIMDVVYNHTPEGNELGPTLSLRGLDNATYYHLDETDPRHYWDSTGCGNTVRASHSQTLRLIMDSLRYWVQEMHVDGFRFDLTSSLARNSTHSVDIEGAFITAVNQDPVLRGVKLIAEPWDVSAGGYLVGSFPEPWSEWNDQFRDTVRDFWRGQSGGVAELGWRLTGSGDMYWDQIGGSHASVNFVTAHDGFTLHDVVSYNDKHNLDNGEDNRDGTNSNRSWNCGVEGSTNDPAILAHRRRQMRNLMATTILSAGVPMILSGDEFGHSQRGNNNAYCQNNDTTWLNWHVAEWQHEMRNFTTHVMQLRHRHRVFRRSGYLLGKTVDYAHVPDLAWFKENGTLFEPADWESFQTRNIGIYLAGAVADRDRVNLVDNAFYWFLNSSDKEVRVTLPSDEYASEYKLMFNTQDEKNWESGVTLPAGETVTLAAWSCALWMVTER